MRALRVCCRLSAPRGLGEAGVPRESRCVLQVTPGHREEGRVPGSPGHCRSAPSQGLGLALCKEHRQQVTGCRPCVNARPRAPTGCRSSLAFTSGAVGSLSIILRPLPFLRSASIPLGSSGKWDGENLPAGAREWQKPPWTKDSAARPVTDWTGAGEPMAQSSESSELKDGPAGWASLRKPMTTVPCAQQSPPRGALAVLSCQAERFE